MKKLIFVFVALFILVLISGCNARNNNTVRFDDNGADITSDVTSDDDDSEDVADTSDENVEEVVVKAPSGKLEVISFDGAYLKSNLSHNIVRGGASSDAHTITINDYKLQKYYQGQGEWSYIASSTYGTLEDGWNNYVVKTFDKEEKQIDSLIFSIEYEAPVVPDELPDVGASHWLLLFFSIITGFTYTVFRKLRWL